MHQQGWVLEDAAGGPIDDDSEQEMKAWPGDDEMDVLRLVGLLQ